MSDNFLGKFSSILEYLRTVNRGGFAQGGAKLHRA
jgi:hypothetical protein